MYRFKIGSDNWILRFFRQVSIEEQKKEIILKSLFDIGSSISLFSHGEAFIIVDKNIGSIVIKVEKIPSNILVVCNIIQHDNCYFQSE